MPHWESGFELCLVWLLIMPEVVDELKLSQLYRLTFPIPIPDEERKLADIFIFTLLCGDSKEGFKAFIKSILGNTNKCENRTFS